MAEQEYDKEQLRILRNAFKAFDHDNKGSIDHSDVHEILEILGQKLDEKAIKALLKEVDKGNTGKLDFNQFCRLAARFVEVEEDVSALQSELREAFRIYDKEGKGYLSVQTLRGILKELDDKLSNQDLDMIIEEIDADGSGTVDFDEFMQVMTGKDFVDFFLNQRFHFEPRYCCQPHRMRLHKRIEWHFERFWKHYLQPISTPIVFYKRSYNPQKRIQESSSSLTASYSNPNVERSVSNTNCCYRPVYRPRFPKWIPILTLYREIIHNPFRRNRSRYMITNY